MGALIYFICFSGKAGSSCYCKKQNRILEHEKQIRVRTKHIAGSENYTSVLCEHVLHWKDKTHLFCKEHLTWSVINLLTFSKRS